MRGLTFFIIILIQAIAFLGCSNGFESQKTNENSATADQPLAIVSRVSMQGDSLTISAQGTGNVVSQISYTLDDEGSPFATETTAPFAAVLDISGLATGQHEITAEVSIDIFNEVSIVTRTIAFMKTDGSQQMLFEAEQFMVNGFSETNGAAAQANTTNVAQGGRIEIPFTLAEDGTYVLRARVNAPSTGENSFYINIDDEPVETTNIWDITELTNGMEERVVSWRGNGTFNNNQFSPKTFTLAAGSHTLIIVGRERNTAIDSIRLDLASNDAPSPIPAPAPVPMPEPTPDPDPMPMPNPSPSMCMNSNCLLSVDFQNRDDGDYSVAEMDADFNWVGDFQNGLGQGRANIMAEGGDKFLRIKFNQGTRGHMQWKADLGGAHEDVTLRYRVRFVNNVDFRDGGKLPGLAGGTHPTGGQDSANGQGFSARFNWRNTNSNPAAFITQYMYDMDKPNGRTGRHITLGGSPIYLQSNHWYEIESRIKMNTPGQANGIIQAWLDGVQVLNITNARLRANSNQGTDVLYFSTFFGGSNTPAYQTTKDEFFDYDDFEVIKN